MSITKKDHHEQEDLCSHRPQYRQGKKLTAVKVYTVTDESCHLLVINVPAINLQGELCNLCNRFGNVTKCIVVPEYQCEEQFVETYHIQYARIQSARFAKKQLDCRNFFGGILHVCYAPELETIDETRGKLIQRRKEVAARIRGKINTNAKTFKSNKEFSEIIDKAGECTSNSINNLVKNASLPHESNTDSLAPYTSLEIQEIQRKCLPEQQSTSLQITNPTTSTAHSSAPQTSNSHQSFKTTTFIPRPLAVPKRIVFHNKMKKS